MFATYLATAITISTAIAPALVGQSTASNKIITGEIQSASRYEITVKGKAETVTLAITSETDISIDRKPAPRDKLTKGQTGTFLYDSVEEVAINVKVSTADELARREAEKKSNEMEAEKAAKEIEAIKAKSAARKAKEEADRRAIAARAAAVKEFYRGIVDGSALGLEFATAADTLVIFDKAASEDIRKAALVSDAELKDKHRELARSDRAGTIPQGAMLRVIEANRFQKGLARNSKEADPVIIVKCRILSGANSDKGGSVAGGMNMNGREVWVIASSIAPPVDEDLFEAEMDRNDTNGDSPKPKSSPLVKNRTDQKDKDKASKTAKVKSPPNNKSGKVSFFGIDVETENGTVKPDKKPDR